MITVNSDISSLNANFNSEKQTSINITGASTVADVPAKVYNAIKNYSINKIVNATIEVNGNLLKVSNFDGTNLRFYTSCVSGIHTQINTTCLEYHIANGSVRVEMSYVNRSGACGVDTSDFRNQAVTSCHVYI